MLLKRSLPLMNSGLWEEINMVLQAHERKGGSHPRIRAMQDFNEMMEDCGLFDADAGLQGPSSFRFLNMWVKHHGFLDAVNNNWNLSCEIQGLDKLQQKLFRLKQFFRWWNKNVFGNVIRYFSYLLAQENVQLADDDLHEIHKLVSDNEADALCIAPLTDEIKKVVW
ncbi:hypothetical protein BUALT_Bualt03G0212500 [Buddleja alternifolia]|uniref:Uncharacterized protein n=1 Tax=Buddleja alternifolia TaxID=168488 RepID=A0AAV6XXA6_9LAMI|nr:hypothetical protein BUALT_Bualt03G0212500 [Buddleja alternifolia]